MVSKFQRRLDEQKKNSASSAAMPQVATVVAQRDNPAPSGNADASRMRSEIGRPAMEPSGQIIRVRADEVYEVEQVRPEEDFDEEILSGMVESFSEFGNLTPPRCFPKDRQGYRVWFGATRVRSMKRRGDEFIDIYVGTPPRDERQRIMGQLIENLQQSGLKPLATALAFEQLKNQYGMSGEEIATALGKPTAFVSKHMRIGAAPEKIRSLVRGKKLSDVELIYNLIQLNETSEQCADDLISRIKDGETITRAQVKKELSRMKKPGNNNGFLQESLQKKISHAKSQEGESGSASPPQHHGGEDHALSDDSISQRVPVIMYQGREGVLLLDTRPEQYGMVWIKTEQGREYVVAGEVSLMGLR